jgi:glucosamine-6-phosphate deaminase
MHLHVVNDYQELSRCAAELFIEAVSRKPDSAVVLATGNTPMGMYRVLTEHIQAGKLDTSQLLLFQLDGYLGVSLDDPRSLEGWLVRSVLEPWGISSDRFVRLPEDAKDTDLVCSQYDEAVRRVGGLDLAVLGLGPNGHLGFNEPPSAADAPTRVVSLTPESVKSNARYWGSEKQVPRKSITAGMDVLLRARQILLLVSGESKRDILKKTLFGPVTEEVPSSFLQLHPNVTVFADRAAFPDEV